MTEISAGSSRSAAFSDLLLVLIFVAFRRGCQQLNHSRRFVPRNEAHASAGACFFLFSFFVSVQDVCVSELTGTAQPEWCDSHMKPSQHTWTSEL